MTLLSYFIHQDAMNFFILNTQIPHGSRKEEKLQLLFHFQYQLCPVIRIKIIMKTHHVYIFHFLEIFTVLPTIF